ncbi:AAA family ATPase [Metallosphaera hakonensis JCM 8857 = DSM 7519]|uniref:CobQ/CobB/MinD/ParA nucleotide binding domain-containing protein n=1 Tax=Metallosphaera hakonensis JCM 8857 = DSM 7519 TaxID=1293036 RepID=A0A2U9IX78_9CREN|nr:AAA family ATPase [Metallosphaera hakonensis JCM 8857 = DSM 7519]
MQSAKGGVGKSTISMNLTLALASSGLRVLLVDRDNVGYSSKLAGIEEPGVLSSVIDGLNIKPVSHFKFGKGTVTVVKISGDGTRHETDIQKLVNDASLKERFKAVIEDILKSFPHDFSIVDNPSLIFHDNPLVQTEVEVYLKLYPDRKVVRFYVLTAHMRLAEETVAYIRRAEDRSKLGSPLGMFVNMIPPGQEAEAERILNHVMERTNLKLGVLIPFSEEIFQFSEEMSSMPILPQIKKMSELIISGDLGNHVIK